MHVRDRGRRSAGRPFPLARPWRSLALSLAVAAVLGTGAAPAPAALADRVKALERRLESAADRLNDAQSALGHTESLVRSVGARVEDARQSVERARAGIAGLARRMYIQGPASFAEVILGGRDFSELVDRIALTRSLQSHNRDVIQRVAVARKRLEQRESSLDAVLSRQEQIVAKLRAQHAQINDLFRRNSALLRASRAQTSSGGSNSFVRRSGGVLEVCPVDRPRAFSNDFGAPRSGGRSHQGIDILAPKGTPIRAPFGGRVERRSHSLSGLAFRIYGKGGYAFGAHLSSYGAGGSVSAGTVIGYVGNTGNASGGPAHLHFEWHPGSGGAINPYSMLRSAC